MRIVQVAAEFAPIAKAGGLAEVLVGLCRELTRQKKTVEVILPKYDFIPHSLLPHLNQETEFIAFEWEQPISNTMWSAKVEECNLRLLEMRHPKNYFQRGQIYGFDDDVPRFIYFAKAVLEYLKTKKEPIDILHLHDWHVAALAPLLRQVQNELRVGAIVLSIHNLEYQGQCSVHDLAAIGLQKEEISPLQTGSHYNLLKGAIHYADAITTVSPTYAAEILTQEFGFGLDEQLRKRKGVLTGILNGLDLKLWNPANDCALQAHYSVIDPMATILEAKKKNREGFYLRKDLPWFGAITRLVPQKGPYLIEAALQEAIRQNAVFVLLGASPILEMQRHFEGLRKKYLNHPQVLIHLEYDEALAHRVFAALDFLVISSLFEPCGLTQLIAMHYGTVPIVRSTGGLKDTVFDCDDPLIPSDKRNGFTFFEATREAVANSLKRALHQYRNEIASHELLIKNGMKTDFGWAVPAQKYLKIYSKSL